MLIRRNTRPFKTILEIITACQNRVDREKLVRVYITKAGHSIEDRISVEGIQGEADVFYDLTYNTVLNNLQSSGHQLHHSDDTPGIYFLRSAINKIWDETPFEFDDAVKKEFASLSDLPVTRKKGKAEKFVFPAPETKTAKRSTTKEKKEKEKAPARSKGLLKEKATKVVDDKPKQPNYKLKHKIQFTGLDTVVFRQPKLTKEDVLDYYNKIADYILPYLKDRPQLIRRHAQLGKPKEYLYLESLTDDVREELPDWIQTVAVTEDKERKHLLLCNNKEHLLLYAEIGCLQFNPCHARSKSFDSPDYIVMVIDPSDGTFGKAIEVALIAQEILTGLQLPSFIKTDGLSGLHIYIPLDSKSKFETCKAAGEYIGKLIRLKSPDLVALKGTDDSSYGKVLLDIPLNEKESSVVAPYSLVPGEMATVAAPLSWEEVNEDLRVEDFTYATIFKRLGKGDDPFEGFFKKKVNAKVLLERLEANYSFLF